MSPHLTVSYANAPASTPAPAAGTAAPTSDTSPLGFLSALLDQILAANSDPSAVPAPSLATTSSADLTGLLEPAVSTPPVPEALNVLADLTDALGALDAALKSGAPVDPDLLKKLSDTADALAGMLNLQAATPATAAPVDPLDPLATITASTTVNASTSSEPAPPAPPTLPAIAALATRITDAAKVVAASAPDLAQKLTALGTTLTAAQATPELLAKLNLTGDQSGKSVDQLVQALLDRATQTTPATPVLKTPEPLVQPSVLGQAVSTSADPDAAALKLAVATEAPNPSDAGARPKAETDLKVATTAPPPSDTPDTPPPQPNAAAAAIAPLARTIQAAYQPIAAQAATLPQLAFEMVRQFHQGQSHFTVRLDPPELGRVDVRMHVDASGNVNARLTVERSETLDMFQRDQRTLERALAQAGLDSSKTNLEFSLRQNPFSAGGQQGQSDFSGNGGFAFSRLSAEEREPALPAITLYRGTVSAGGVNLYV